MRSAMLPILLAAFAAGCGQTRQTGPPLGTVAGVVTYQQKPVAGASVAFLPTMAGARPAVGLTDSVGRYRLSLSGETDGAIAGPCRVTIALRAPYAGPTPEGISPAYARELFQNQGEPLIPEKYFSAQTSGLTADVQAGRRNTFDFALTE